MPAKLLLAAFLASNFYPVCEGAQVTGTILNYGIFERHHKEQVIKTPETSSGATRIDPSSGVFASTTNMIPARIGIAFGIAYRLSSFAETNGSMIELEKVVTHPMIRRPDGTVSRGFTFIEKRAVENGQIINATGYSFDHDYELVPGLWVFELKLNGKRLVKHCFTVYSVK